MNRLDTSNTATGRSQLPSRLQPILFTALLAFAIACGSGANRADQHASRANVLIEEGRYAEAVLELRAASQIHPEDRALTVKIAETFSKAGDQTSAREYYKEAYALDPTDLRVAIDYAGTLADSDPEQATSLINAILETEPQQAEALLVQARLLLSSGKTREAHRIIEQARRIKPDDPDIEWALAELLLIQSRNLTLLSASSLQRSEPLNAILVAYNRYLQKGGTRRVGAALGRARAFKAWASGTPEAGRAYGDLISIAISEGSPDEKMRALEAAAAYGRSTRDLELEKLALEESIRNNPQQLATWTRLATILSAQGNSEAKDQLFEDMFKELGHGTDVQIAYARHLARSGNPVAAVAYLNDQVERGGESEPLWTALFHVQIGQGRYADSARTLSKVQKAYPDSASTTLLIAEQQIAERHLQEALVTLQALIRREAPTSQAWRLIAQIEHQNAAHEKALSAIEKAIELDGRTAPNLRIKARVLLEIGRGREAALSFGEIAEKENLTIDERLLMARGYYESKGELHGRRILEGLLDGPNPEPQAALALARWELQNPSRQEKVRTLLASVYQRYPENVELLEVLSRDDLGRGRNAAAVARVTRAIQRRPRAGGLYLVRAAIWKALGRTDDAIKDAQKAASLNPRHRDEAYSLIIEVSATPLRRRAAIQALESQKARGEISPDDLALLAHLYLRNGQLEHARTLYEQALLEGSELIILKNDLAHLLALQGEDFERALELARLAVDGSDRNLTTADTLGYVYLRSGAYEAAYWQFRFVTREADPPRAEYWYHLGLALIELERPDEARQALSEALRVTPGFPPATQSLNRLDQTRPAHEKSASTS